MNVNIKDFGIALDIKNRGMELEVRSPQNKHLGDLYIGKGTIEWCKGKKARGHGVQKSWGELIAFFEEE